MSEPLDRRILDARAIMATQHSSLDGLTARERRFVEEYPIDLNASAAARRAGYSHKSAKDMGYELLRKPKIVEAMAAVLVKRSARTGIDRAWVLTNLVQAHDTVKDSKLLGAVDRRLKSLELIGRHVDVRAWQAGLTGGGDDGSTELWDLTKLDDEELKIFERLLAKIAIAPPSPRGDSPAGA